MLRAIATALGLAAVGAVPVIAEGPVPDGGARQLLIVAPGYWRAGDARKFSFEVYDLGDGFKRVHRAEPGNVGEVRGICFSPATQRLYVSGHEGMLCYGWPDKKLLWRRPVEGPKANQNDAVTVTVDGARLYTIRHFGKGLNVYDAADGRLLRVIHENEKHSWGRFSQVTHDGKRLFAGKCDGGGGEVFILDTADDRMIGRFKPVIEPIRFALSPDGRWFVQATGGKRGLAVCSAADGGLLHEIAVPAWDGAVTGKAPVQWMALSPDGKQAWACDAKNSCLHRFDLASDPPRYAGRVEVEKGTEGLMFSVDGRFLVDGSGAVRDPADGKAIGHLCDESGQPCPASNSMMALEVDATGRVLRTNQQCAPAWPGGPSAADARPPSETPAAVASSRPVLIAAEKSDFKADLVKALTAALKERGVPAEVVALPALAAADPAAYRAIVLITLVPEWGKTKTVPKFLESKGEAGRSKLVVVTTARSDKWKPPQTGIDAITCASKKEGIGDLVASVLRRIEAK